MYLYGKEHDLMSFHFDMEENNQLCDSCRKAEEDRQLAECKEKHCKNTK